MPDLDTILFILKIIGVVLTGFFAIYGLFGNFTDPISGGLTKRGKWALGLVTGSALLTIISTCFEENSHRKESRRQAKESEKRASEHLAVIKEILDVAKETKTISAQTGKIASDTQKIAERNIETLQEIKRVLNPFRKVALEYWVRVPGSQPLDDVFTKAFYGSVKTILDEKINKHEDVTGVSKIQMKGNSCISFEFDNTFELFPRTETRKLAYDIFKKVPIEVQIYKQPIDTKDHPAINPNSSKLADLVLRFDANQSTRDNSSTVEFSLLKETSPFRLHCKIDPEKISWTNETGKFLSINDFLGSQLFVMLPTDSKSGDPDFDMKVSAIRQHFDLDDLNISIEGGRRIYLSNQFGLKLVPYPAKSQILLYEYMFTTDPDRFAKGLRD